MNSSVAISSAALFAAVANAAECNTVILGPLYVDRNVLRCSADTGLVLGTAPTADTIARVCGNSFCDAAKVSIRSLKLGDCTVDGVALETQFFGPIEAACTGGTATSIPSSLSPSPTATPSAGSQSQSVTPVPTPPTASPGGSTASSSTAATSTPTPTPAPIPASSEASMHAAYAGIATTFLLAVAAFAGASFC